MAEAGCYRKSWKQSTTSLWIKSICIYQISSLKEIVHYVNHLGLLFFPLQLILSFQLELTKYYCYICRQKMIFFFNGSKKETEMSFSQHHCQSCLLSPKNSFSSSFWNFFVVLLRPTFRIALSPAGLGWTEPMKGICQQTFRGNCHRVFS